MKQSIAEIELLYSSIRKEDEAELIEQISKANGLIIGIGAGRMGYALQSFIMRLSHLGFSAYMIGDTSLPRIGRNDLVIVNSSSGETKSVSLLAEIAKSSGATIILITSNPASTLGKLSDLIITYEPIKSNQIMKSAYEQFSLLFFDHCCHELIDKMDLSVSHIENNHSILE